MTDQEQKEALRRGLELVEVFEGGAIERRFLADWRKWSRVSVVTVEDAIHLSLGAAPAWADHGSMQDFYRERRDLAEANIGPGGALEIIPGSTDLRYGYVDLREARVHLMTFASWVLANGMKVAADCPQPKPRACIPQEEEGERQQTTRARANGMLALTLAKRVGAVNDQGKINVHRLSETALDAIEGHIDLKGLGRSTLSKYIKEGLDALRGE